jgi:hypothetical protein
MVAAKCAGFVGRKQSCHPDQPRGSSPSTTEGFYIIMASQVYYCRRQVHRVAKAKGAFTSDTASLKLICLAHRNIKRNGHALAKRAVTTQKLAVWFPGRMVLDLQ